MERLFWVKNGEIARINEWLQKGGRIKAIYPVSENIVAYGYAGGETSLSDHSYYVSDIYAYVVIEFD